MDAILYLHHKPLDTGITRRHLMLLKALNPDCRVIPLSYGYGKYEFSGRFSHPRSVERQKRCGDILVYEWFNRIRPKFDRYFFIEWDTFCTQSLKDFYGAAYLKPCVGSVIVSPWSDELMPCENRKMKNWHWFEHANTEYLHKNLRGIVPMCGVMYSHGVLEKMIAEYMSRTDYDGLNSECRMGTMAVASGFEPERISETAHEFISWKDVEMKQTLGVWHRVKK